MKSSDAKCKLFDSYFVFNHILSHSSTSFVIMFIGHVLLLDVKISNFHQIVFAYEFLCLSDSFIHWKFSESNAATFWIEFPLFTTQRDVYIRMMLIVRSKFSHHLDHLNFNSNFQLIFILFTKFVFLFSLISWPHQTRTTIFWGRGRNE